jgi:uncharacterized membrane protein YoaK (UPF0700 family)
MENIRQAEPLDNAVRIMLLLLTCTAGVVDATAYLRLGQIFLANMTGNTVLLALHLGGAGLGAVAGNLMALIGFCAGAALFSLIHREPRKTAFQTLTPTLVVEVVLMSIVTLLWQLGQSSYQLPLIGIAALAMGLQAAMAGRIAVSGVSTVTITNTLTRDMNALVLRLRGQRTDESRSNPFLFLASDWLAYFVGALVVASGSTIGVQVPFLLSVILLTIALALAIRTTRFAEQ